MASSNPMSTALDSTQSLVQRFYLANQNLAVDVMTAGGEGLVTQNNVPSDAGTVSTPGSIVTVKRQGLVIVYGVTDIEEKQKDGNLIPKYIVSQISPTVSPIIKDRKFIYLGDNKSIAATSDNKDKGFLFALQREGATNKIVQWTIDYNTNAEPAKKHGDMTDINDRTRLGAAIIRPTNNLSASRLLAYQTGANNIRIHQWTSDDDDDEDGPVSNNDIMEQTPLAVAVKQGPDDRPTVYVYYVSASNTRLMRAMAQLGAPRYKVEILKEVSALDKTTDLAATVVPGGVLVSFITDGNTTYSQHVDSGKPAAADA